jgi:hypothetical protein
MTESFECPNCSASLAYDSRSQSSTVKCEFCGSTVIVPEILRPPHQNRTVRQEVQPTYGTIQDETQSGTASNNKLGRIVGCTVAFVFVMVIVATVIPLATGGLLFFGIFDQESGRESSEPGIAQESIVERGEEPGLASLILEFGGQEGTGPGFFDDTRSIAVDGEGRIYTGDYQGGRIQVFDAQGNFLNLWHTGDDGSMSGLASSRDGVLYVLQGDGISLYEGATGELLGLIPDSEWPLFDAVSVAPDGSVAAAGYDDLALFDSEGNLTLNLPDAFDQFEMGGTTRSVDVDGAGNIYVLTRGLVYRFDAQGNYIDRIGSEGDEPDQFKTSPTALAIDGQDRIFVEDFYSIKVFDGNGRYLGIIEHGGVAFDMVFNDQNELLVMERNGNRVLKYALNQ